VYKIYIQDLKVEAIIGILEHERINPQLIVINSEIEYCKNENDFVNYAEIVDIIEDSLVKNNFFLLEDALEEITAKIKKRFIQIFTIKLELKKPKILNNCIVGVEIFKKY
jgi:dihydroneopterin aldolase